LPRDIEALPLKSEGEQALGFFYLFLLGGDVHFTPSAPVLCSQPPLEWEADFSSRFQGNGNRAGAPKNNGSSPIHYSGVLCEATVSAVFSGGRDPRPVVPGFTAEGAALHVQLVYANRS
ncbi:unnamed protein product, partial [Discosporangium mesarthrocarpum]